MNAMVQAQVTPETIRFWMTACLTPVIAAFGAWIAYQQHRIQKYRLIYDVSARRLCIFNASRQLIIAGCSDANTTDESLFAFQASTVEGPYLFRDKTVRYLDELEQRFKQMLELKDEIADHTERQSADLSRMKGELRVIRESMRSELKTLRKEFKPYLDLSAV
jgi:hypothetical protein